MKQPIDYHYRLTTANKAIEIIAKYGRHFFSLQGDRPNTPEPNRVSFFERRNGRLWFVDKWTQKATYVAYRRGRWKHFSDGGTLRDLICNMADWINGKKERFPIDSLGPFPSWCCDGDLWGYGKDMAKVRHEIIDLLVQPSRFLTEAGLVNTPDRITAPYTV